MLRFAKRTVEIAGLMVLVAFVAGPQPGLSQVPSGFTPSGIGSMPPDATEPDSISRQHFEHQLDGPSGIQPADPAAAEARRQGLIGNLNVAVEEIINRPTDLLLGGILRNANDNNIGGTNNP